jgi:hypothetical protein
MRLAKPHLASWYVNLTNPVVRQPYKSRKTQGKIFQKLFHAALSPSLFCRFLGDLSPPLRGSASKEG